jgi:LuxR family transcriptional regulator, quorum-sensing system regulator BjaR1
VLERVLSLVEPVIAAPSAVEASHLFHKPLERLGATYLQTRLYRRPFDRLTPRAHWDAGGFVARIARPGWVGSDGFTYICIDCNPLVHAIEQRRTRYRFSDYAPHAAKPYGAYWEAFSQARMGEILATTAYGEGRRVATVHMGFEQREFATGEAEMLHLAGALLVERLLDFSDQLPPAPEDSLTQRERDCLAFVAEGKTDWEISVILGLAATTVRSHVDGARAKLGAANRAQAVARFVLAGGLAIGGAEPPQQSVRPPRKRGYRLR